MTDDKIQTLKDDIAFMRALAQEGSSVPLLFGGNMVAAGLIFGAAAFGHWLIMTGVLVLPGWAVLANWLAAAVIFGVICTLLVRRARGRPGFTSGANRATGSAWSGVGFAIFAMWVGMMAYGYRTGHWEVMNIFPTIIFALYGAAWMVAGDMTGKLWIKLTALGSFVGAVVMGLLDGATQQMLGYAAFLFLLAVVPGVVLMRQEPTDVV